MKGQFLPYKDENPSSTRPVVTTALITVNVAVFVWSLFDFENVIMTWGFTPAHFVAVTLLTSMFLHGGIDHIFGNMLYLYIYGDNIEDRFGRWKYILFYLLAGLAAGLVHFLSEPGSLVPAIGASGAISGVLGAYLAMFPRVKIRAIGPFYMIYRIPAYVLIGFWFLLQLIFGTISLVGGIGSGIAFWAHIGGFAFGYLIGRLYRSRNVPQPPMKLARGFFGER
jgi:membrane associated rhomboid family serine protease